MCALFLWTLWTKPPMKIAIVLSKESAAFAPSSSSSPLPYTVFFPPHTSRGRLHQAEFAPWWRTNALEVSDGRFEFRQSRGICVEFEFDKEANAMQFLTINTLLVVFVIFFLPTQDPTTNTYWRIYDGETGELIEVGVDSHKATGRLNHDLQAWDTSEQRMCNRCRDWEPNWSGIGT